MRKSQFDIGSNAHDDAYTVKHSERYVDVKKMIKMCASDALAVRLGRIYFWCAPHGLFGLLCRAPSR